MQYTDEQLETGEHVRDLAASSPYGWKAFYKSSAWTRKRREILQRDHHACQVCKRHGRYARADTVHHVVHLKDAPELALSADNLESVCRVCHEKIHQQEKLAEGFWTPERW